MNLFLVSNKYIINNFACVSFPNLREFWRGERFLNVVPDTGWASKSSKARRLKTDGFCSEKITRDTIHFDGDIPKLKESASASIELLSLLLSFIFKY